MADIRINSLPTTASASSSDDFLALDGATNGTRKLNAYSPTFGGNLTVSGTIYPSGASATLTASVANTIIGSNGATRLQIDHGNGGWGRLQIIPQQTRADISAVLNNATTAQTLGLVGSSVEILTSGGTLAATFNSSQNTTLAGNLTVSGNTNTFGSGTVDTDVIVNGGAVGSYSSALKYRSAGTEYWKVGRGAGTGGANFEWYDYQGTPGTRFTIASSTGNATLSGNLTVSGGTITGGASGLSLASGGTNQNITLTPSGTGRTIINANSLALNVTGTNDTSLVYGRFGTSGSTGQLFVGVEGSVAGSLNTDTLAYAGYIGTASSGTALQLATAGGVRATITSGGNFLIGTTTNGSNGKLQLADHTTSAGGIGFGTDIAIYRAGTNNLVLTSIGQINSDFTISNSNGPSLGFNINQGNQITTLTNRGNNSMVFQTNSTTALTLDSSQNATFAGKITANGAGSTFKGTATNDSAAAGYVGEFVSSIVASGSAVSLTTNTITNVTSISLTAGDWDVFGAVDFIPEAATVRTRSIGAVSTTSASLPATYYRNTLTLGTTDANAETYGGPTPVQRISISSTTTVYLVAFATFSGGTQTAHGYIQARRVR